VLRREEVSSLDPLEALVLRDCPNLDRATHRLGAADGELDEADGRLDEKAGEIDGIVDQHGFEEQQFVQLGRQLGPRVGGSFR
jgi:hypothetical protein